MGKRFYEGLLLFLLVIALTCTTGCTINNDPSIVAREYLNCLKAGDCQKAASYTESGEAFSGELGNRILLKWALGESIFQTPAIFSKEENAARVRFQILVPDVGVSNNTTDKHDIVYKKLIAEIRLVKSEGVWKIAQENNPIFNQILNNS